MNCAKYDTYRSKLHRFHILCISHGCIPLNNNCNILYSVGLKLFACLCRLLITFANSLDPDQAQHNVRPDLDSNCLTLMVFLKEFFEKVDFKKIIRCVKKACKITQ